MRKLTAIVTRERDGAMVKGILRNELQISYTLMKRLKWCDGAILLNGESVHVNAVVHAGDEVSVILHEKHLPPLSKSTLHLDVVYEDEDLLVINKPAGVAMHPKRTGDAVPDLAQAVSAHLGEGYGVHFVNRLDKGTSGLLIAAKSGYIHNCLRRALHTNALLREYRAVVEGELEQEKGSIDLPIARAENSIVRRTVRADGLPCHTEYEVLAKHGAYSLVRLLPSTGRTHQLRVHMAAIGHPLVGDWLYGKEEAELIARPALHSYALHLKHPVSGEDLDFIAPIPQDMERLMEN